MTPWSRGGRTDLGDGAPACHEHRDMLTKHGYRLERRDGVTHNYGPDGRLIHTRTNRWRK